MNARFLRPFARAAFRAPAAVRPTAMARPALAASQSKKTEPTPQQMVSWLRVVQYTAS
jgi:F-type H+-transporting ATPase subunit 8